MEISAARGCEENAEYRLVSVERGGAPLPKETVFQRYETLGNGVEQFFDISTMPAGTGDLVIRGTLNSSLLALSATPQEIVFSDGCGTRFSYRDAFVVDAAGRKTPIDIGFQEGSTSLTVPGDWLACATFPVVVDPLLRVASIESAPAVITKITSSTPNGAYTTYENINLTVYFSDVVTLTGDFFLLFNSGGMASTGLNGVRVTSLPLVYNISRTAWSPDLNVTAITLHPSWATLRDGAGNNVPLSVAANTNLGALKDLVVDARTFSSTWQHISGPPAGNGWRLMGPVGLSTTTLPTSAIVNSVTGLQDQLLTPFYNKSNQVVTSLVPGTGYWVKTTPGAMRQQVQGSIPTGAWTFRGAAGLHYKANPFAGAVPVDAMKGGGSEPIELYVYRQRADGSFGWVDLMSVKCLNKFEGFVIKFHGNDGWVTLPASNE